MNELGDVKVGELLAHNGTWGEPGLTKVEKVTKTLIVCGAGRFRRENGWAVGVTGYSRSRVWRPTPADILKVRIHRAQSGIANLKVDEASVDDVEALLTAIKLTRGKLKSAAS